MHSALLVIEKKTGEDFRVDAAWESSMAAIKEILKIADQVQPLAENTLLIPLQSDLSTLSLLISECLKRHLSYKVLFLDEAPNWVFSPDQFHAKK